MEKRPEKRSIAERQAAYQYEMAQRRAEMEKRGALGGPDRGGQRWDWSSFTKKTGILGVSTLAGYFLGDGLGHWLDNYLTTHHAGFLITKSAEFSAWHLQLFFPQTLLMATGVVGGLYLGKKLAEHVH